MLGKQSQREIIEKKKKRTGQKRRSQRKRLSFASGAAPQQRWCWKRNKNYYLCFYKNISVSGSSFCVLFHVCPFLWPRMSGRQLHEAAFAVVSACFHLFGSGDSTMAMDQLDTNEHLFCSFFLSRWQSQTSIYRTLHRVSWSNFAFFR